MYDYLMEQFFSDDAQWTQEINMHKLHKLMCHGQYLFSN